MIHHFGSPIAIGPQWVSKLQPIGPRTGRRSTGRRQEARFLALLLPHLQRALDFYRRFVEPSGFQRP